MKKIINFIIFFILLFSFSNFGIAESGDSIVYVTRSGECYHRDGCSYLESKVEITLSAAVDAGYRPCSRCKPPKIDSTKSVLITETPKPTFSANSNYYQDNYIANKSIVSVSSAIDKTNDLFNIFKYFIVFFVVIFSISKFTKRSGNSSHQTDSPCTSFQIGKKYYFWDKNLNSVSSLVVTELYSDSFAFSYQGKMLKSSYEHAKGKFYSSLLDVPQQKAISSSNPMQLH